MYYGFSVGYFLFGENETGRATKQIGVSSKQHRETVQAAIATIEL